MSSVVYPDYINTEFHSKAFNDRKNNKEVEILVLHYTASLFNRSLMLLTKNVSSHYLVDEKPKKIYRLVNEDKRAWHAGVSYWREEGDVNSASLGIEIVGVGYTYGNLTKIEYDREKEEDKWVEEMRKMRHIGEKGLLGKRTWHDFPDYQITSVIELSKAIVKKYKIEPENVVGHSDVAPNRKVDPGPKFPWKKLADSGIGMWPKDDVVKLFSTKSSGISVSWFQKTLKDYGYGFFSLNGKMDQETEKVTKAFQMHFRSKNFDGKLDEETCKILENINCQRINRKKDFKK
jgi:N-acetylmuramoyl-L-alanine amidase